MVAKSWNIQLFSVLAVVYANDGWTKLQFAYFDYFPVYYFVQVHRICLSMLFKTHSLVDHECTWLRLFQKRIGYTKSKKSLKIPKGQSESVYRRRTDNTMAKRKRTNLKDKQRSTKHTYKTKDRVTRTPLKTRGELGCSEKVGSSCSTSYTHRVNLVKCATSRILRTNPYNTGEMIQQWYFISVMLLQMIIDSRNKVFFFFTCDRSSIF